MDVFVPVGVGGAEVWRIMIGTIFECFVPFLCGGGKEPMVVSRGSACFVEQEVRAILLGMVLVALQVQMPL